MKRLLVGVFLLVSVLSLAGCGMITTAEDAAEQAGAIADFTVPSGFAAELGMDVAEMLMVGYTHSDQRSHIYLMQVPESANVSVEQMEEEMRKAVSSSSGQESATIVESEEVALTIMGQEVTGTIGRGTSSSDDTSYRVLSVPFMGKGGPAILIFERPEASWDQAEVEHSSPRSNSISGERHDG